MKKGDFKVDSSNVKQKELDLERKEFSHKGWDFFSEKGGILPSNELDQLVDGLELNNIPDVVFGTSKFRMQRGNFVLEINPRDSLRYCNFKVRENRFSEDLSQETRQLNQINILPSEVQVKYADHWKKKNLQDLCENEEIKHIQQISDCFYSTPYKGSVYPKSLEKEKVEEFLKKEAACSLQQAPENEFVQLNQQFKSSKTDEDIPVHRLSPDNPIIWSTMIHLWEDEIGDSGYTMSELRFRVMQDCFFGLLRHYLRVDDVLIRIYDTRYFHDFQNNYLIREFQVREDNYQNIQAKGFKFSPEWMIDPNQSHQIYNSVAVKKILKEKIFF